MADLITFTLAGGQVCRITSADINLTVDGRVFTAAGFKRSRTRTTVGIAVDTLDVEVFAAIDETVGGLAWVPAVFSGQLDGARAVLERVFMPTFGDTSPGTLTLFVGAVADVECDGLTTRLTINSDTELLNVMMPRNLYEAPCGAALYDSACGTSKDAHRTAATIQAGSTRLSLRTSLTQPDGWADYGTVTFSSGQNAGSSYTVKRHAGGVLTLTRGPLFVPAAGDTISVLPGCDKTLTTCRNKFGNEARFRGTPFIPVPETSY